MIDVVAAVIFSGDHILIARRGPGKDLAGYWEFPGGKIEPGESTPSCLEREIKEELSLQISIANHLLTSTFKYPNKTINLISFICHLEGGTCQLIDHDRIEWVLPSELEKFVFAPADVPVIGALKEYLENK
jgi:8-oxo-dGTP diphosphatase